MSIEIPMKREGNHLVPVDQVAADMLESVPANTGVMVVVKVPRNLRQFRLAWALADIVAKSVDFLHDREDAMDWLKIKARHVRMIQDPLRGTVAIVPKSIAFASLDQAGFARVLDRMIYVTTTEIIPGMEESSLRAELESIVGMDPKPKPEPAPKARKAKKPDAQAAAQPEASEKQEGGTDAAEASADREPDASPPNRPAQPTNETEYVAACRSWLRKQTERHPSFDYFNGAIHRQMRIDLKVSTQTRKQLEKEIGEHFDARDKADRQAAAEAKRGGSAGDDRQPGQADSAAN